LRGAELAIHARSLTTETVFATAPALAHDCHPTVLRWDLLQDNRVSGVIVPSEFAFSMSRFVKRSASQAVKSGPSGRWATLPAFVPAQLSQLVAKPPSGPQWLHEIKLDAYRMAARHRQWPRAASNPDGPN
jgi:hypothetical protein